MQPIMQPNNPSDETIKKNPDTPIPTTHTFINVKSKDTCIPPKVICSIVGVESVGYKKVAPDGIQTQHLLHARQAPYPLATAPLQILKKKFFTPSQNH